MMNESFPLINYHIWKPIPLYFSLQLKFLQLQAVISGSILIMDSKKLAYVPSVVTFKPRTYLLASFYIEAQQLVAYTPVTDIFIVPPRTSFKCLRPRPIPANPHSFSVRKDKDTRRVFRFSSK